MTEPTPYSAVQEGRERARRAFRFLRALQDRRNPPPRRVADYGFTLPLEGLPEHPAVVLGGDALLRVRRPELTPAPNPPKGVEGGEDPLKEPTSDNEAALAAWLPRWRVWADARRMEDRVMRLYLDLYAQSTILEREGERYAMALGDGRMRWELPEGAVDHPLVLQPLEIRVDARAAEIALVESDRPRELSLSALASEAVEGRTLAKVREAFENLEDDEPVDGFLRTAANLLEPSGATLRIGGGPVALRRDRSLGLAQAIDRVSADLEDDAREEEPVSDSLRRILGVARDAPKAGEAGPESDPEEDREVYFTKPTNLEQHRIVARLRQEGSVLVQGPPGTGKTHTIANLLGHLLAEGKSVLVTSHTAKALAVVREKVAEPLRGLCVSLVAGDREGKAQLEASVAEIGRRLAEDPDARRREIGRLTESRERLFERVGRLRTELRAARRSEYEPVDGMDPSEAARWTAAGRTANGWIPGELRGETPPDDAEIRALYASNVAISADDERNAPDVFPDLTPLCPPAAYADALAEARDLRARDLALPSTLVLAGSVEEAAEARKAVVAALEALDGAAWKRRIVEAARRGQAQDYAALGDEAEALAEAANATRTLRLRVGPRWTSGVDPVETIAACREVESHLAGGGKLNFLSLVTHPAWKRASEALATADGPPRAPEAFAAGRAELELAGRRTALRRLWDGLIGAIGGPALPEEGAPEEAATVLVPDLRDALAWSAERLPTLELRLRSLGFRLPEMILRAPATLGPAAETERLVAALRDEAVPQIERLEARRRLAALEGTLRRAAQAARTLAERSPGADLLAALETAAAEERPEAYAPAYEGLLAVRAKAEAIVVRREALRRLALVAPDWAGAVARREGPHGEGAPPGPPAEAWRWRRIAGELERRAEVSIQSLVSALAEARRERDRTTADLVEAMAWAAQAERIDDPTRQALYGLADAMRKLGKGTGKGAPRLLAEIRRLTERCQNAVPVWIMPMTRVAETFDLAHARFDVVIVDEASQLDLSGLLALYAAREAIVVGDHEQVEPSAVGENVEAVQDLVDAHLKAIPNAVQWDGRQSVYGLARQSFGAQLALREHFRCVPTIIGFSNALAYRGEILPLREDSGVRTRPFVVAESVRDARIVRDANAAEAERLVALLAACIERPEYAGLTFGAIHLVGDDDGAQTRLVRTLAERRIGLVELEERRFRVGSPPQFQGDERDVVFLSLVDAPKDGPLPRRTAEANHETFKKRYNVAASRARDQMWVLHSLDPNVDLQPGDIRRELVLFAQDPDAKERARERLEPRTESDFERRVLRRLLDAGYRSVEPQYRVGAYRIDFVVEGGGGRIALECDGEAYHGAERLDDDMARQATLERLGWRFVRIRGSEFYRDEAAAMRRAFDEMATFGVAPGGSAETSGRNDGRELLDAVRRRADALQREWNGLE